MEGETERIQGASADPEGGGAGREVALQPSAESTTLPAIRGPGPQAKSTLPASSEPVPLTGVTNPSFTDDPPPYSPPDPKTAHLLSLPFQTNVPGQGPDFCQPAPQALNPQPNLVPGSIPFPPHNGCLFVEIPLEAEQRQQPPKDYMVESFLVMTFCCLVTGVFALIYSNEVRTAVARGDLTQASIFSQKARSFVLYSLAFGLLTSACWVIYVLVFLYL
ncbi:proline rich transmembrane protein 1B [Tiliqua scincoides]|uniref:proline rich transmembrane protein 1B n=1 Tax=Tiliqua scincoides TaxID=71010 RepID=UPI003461A966